MRKFGHKILFFLVVLYLPESKRNWDWDDDMMVFVTYMYVCTQIRCWDPAISLLERVKSGTIQYKSTQEKRGHLSQLNNLPNF